MAQSKLRTLVSDLLSRAALATRAGLQFEGNRDLYAVFGYKKKLVIDDLLAKYERQDIASRIVDAPAQATWSNPPTIVPTANSESFSRAWEALIRKHSIWNIMTRLDKLSSLGRYSTLLLGFGDAGTMSSPISKSGNNRLLYLTPLSEKSCEIKEFETDTKNARYGLPKIYSVNRTDLTTLTATGKGSAVSTTKFEVHHSRILHVAQNTLEDNVLGTPIMTKIYNLLDDVLKVAGGTAEGYWLTSNRGMQADIDKDMELDKEDAEALEAEIEEYQHELRRILRTRGVKINTLKADLQDPRGVFEIIIALISGATGIPQRILIGSEAGQLASEQDRANWAERVADRRNEFAQPIILQPFIDKLIYAGILPDIGLYEIKWPDAFRLSPLEKAQTMAQTARAVSNLGRQFEGKTKPFISPDEARAIIALEGPVPVMPALPPATTGSQPKSETVEEEEVKDESLTTKQTSEEN